MPTGGAAIMRSGPNLLKLARKEQCLALLSQLRTKFKTDGQFYRVFPDGEVQYLHPKDGVYPEKVNQGRQAVGANDRSIGKNPNPVSVSARPCMVSDPVTPSKKENAALLAFCCESQCNFGPACVSHGAARSQLPLYAQRRPFGVQNRRAQLP